MKNIAITFLLFFGLITTGFSQFSFGAGVQMIFDGSVLGIQGKALYDVNDSWAGAGTFTYHLEDFYNFSIDFDAHYKGLEISDNFNLAPMVGLSITSFDFGVILGGSHTDTGLNIGAFITFGAGDSIEIYLEPKFILGGAGSLAVSGGILF